MFAFDANLVSDLLFVCVPQHGCVKSGLNLHSHELLEKKLTSIRDFDLADVLARVTEAAVILTFIEIGFTEETTLLAHVHTVTV